MGFLDRLAHAWNAFREDDMQGPFGGVPERQVGLSQGYWHHGKTSYSSFTNDQHIVETIVNKMAVDVGSIEFLHARRDDNDRYSETIDSGLNYCLNQEANIDQTPRDFKQDLVHTILSEGVAAVVPVDTTLNPNKTGGYDIQTIRVGRVVGWYPRDVKVELYNDRTGERQEVLMSKLNVAIIQNPFYSVMNEPNSTLQRLLRKLTLLDTLDNDLVNKKLDLIIQLPYTIKSETKRLQAEQRRQDIEFQLSSGKYGIAYTDATEQITQLNRPVENNLLPTIEYLTQQLYSQLGITTAVLEGTASEQEMLNYFTRTIEPIADAIAEEFTRTFLTKTARTQKQTITYLRRPFTLVPMRDLAEIGDKLTRNEILTSNEVRSMIGFKPSDDPIADELRNSNMPRSDTDPVGVVEEDLNREFELERQNRKEY